VITVTITGLFDLNVETMADDLGSGVDELLWLSLTNADQYL